MKLSYLWRGLPGHPLHPPLTDATIGIYTFATIAGFIEVVGITENNGAIGWWLGLVIGLIATAPTALIGFGFMTLGGWLGGAVVYVHGMRVLSLVDEPTERAVSPKPHPEKEMAEGG